MPWLLRAAGLPDEIAELGSDPRVLTVLTGQAEAFLTAGGVVPPRSWLSLSEVERAALVAAGQRRQVAQAVRGGRASSGEVLEVLAEVDGGVAHDDALMASVVRAIADRDRVRAGYVGGR